jgi:hypothetical protein
LVLAPNIPPELEVVAAPPPNTFDAGLLPVLALLPKSPPDAGAVLVFAPPNIPPLAGADEAAGAVDAVFPPKKPPVAGVVELLLKKPPPAAAGVPEALDVAPPPPKRLPAGLAPNREPPEAGPAAGVVVVLAVAPAELLTELNEKLGVPVAAPNSPPDAGAVVDVLFVGAPDELGVPKLNPPMMMAGNED